MVGMVPNIYLLQYLDATNQKEPELERKAKEYMEVGYNREHKYRHEDGAYSIWGKGDKDGSTWLTAFVVKSFSEASEFIDVDKKDVQESVDWLLATQMENGCFRKRGYVYSSSLKGGGSDESLTSFVLIALLEADDRMEMNVDKRKMTRALDCIMANLNITDVYSYTVATYAANLVKKKSEEWKEPVETSVDHLWDEVKKMANTSEPGALFWDKAEVVDYGWWRYSRSKAVEMTAYNVLTMTLLDDLPTAVQSVKWLAKQRNSRGGFVSTQDTVVALQALSLYSQKVSRDPLDMNIGVEESAQVKNQLDTFSLNEENQLLLQTEKLSSLPTKLTFTASGQGCAMVQTVVRYNMPETEENEGFDLTVNNVDNDKLRICSTYTGQKDKTGMVVMEVELVTGWEAHSLEDLLNEVESGVKRQEFDQEENKVVLYFDDMPKSERCVEVMVKQVTVVEEPKPAIATVYDYYNKEETVSISYNM